MISSVDEKVLKSHCKDYADAHNNYNVSRAQRCKGDIVEFAMRICGYEMDHSGEYVKKNDKE